MMTLKSLLENMCAITKKWQRIDPVTAAGEAYQYGPLLATWFDKSLIRAEIVDTIGPDAAKKILDMVNQISILVPGPERGLVPGYAHDLQLDLERLIATLEEPQGQSMLQPLSEVDSYKAAFEDYYRKLVNGA